MIADSAPPWLRVFPQSALSLLGVGTFIVLSMVVAYAMERLYIRMSIRDDSSDMSEETKNILKASVLGMMFRKKDEFENLKGTKRENAIAKKYVEKWRYKMIQAKQRRRKSEMKAVAKPTSSLDKMRMLCGCCGAKSKSTVDVSSADLGSKRASQMTLNQSTLNFHTVSEGAVKTGAVKPAVTTAKQNNSSNKTSPAKQSPAKAKPEPPKSGKTVRSHTKSEFTTVEMTMAADSGNSAEARDKPTVLKPLNVKDPNTSGMVGLADTSLTSDEFAIDINPQPSARQDKFAKSKLKSGSKNDLSAIAKEDKYAAPSTPSLKTTPAKPPKLLRPLTAGKSRQIAPGGAMKSPPPTYKGAQGADSARKAATKR